MSTIVSKKIVTFEQKGWEKGVFFRNPIVKVDKPDFPFDEDGESCWGWQKRLGAKTNNVFVAIKNFIERKLNDNLFKNLKELSERDDGPGEFAGILVKELVSPIYFKRFVHRAEHKLNHDLIDRIVVFGEEPYENNCAGSCIMEYATIYFKDGTTKTVKTPEKFDLFYSHVVEQMFFSKVH